MRYLVNVCYFLAVAVLAPLVAYRSLKTGKYRRDWDQRRGWTPKLPQEKQRIWIHAVSMGEINSIQGLITAWRRRCPEMDFVVSCTTDTGIDRARKLFPELTVFRYPLDFSWFVTRALDRIRPNMIVLVELEVWYQFVTIASRRGIPVTVVNGRITADKSLRRFRWVMWLIRPMFRALSWVGVQDKRYAERFHQVGVPKNRITVTGSMKWDTAETANSPGDGDVFVRAMGLKTDCPIWVCGSTAPGEETVLLEAYARLRQQHPELQLVIVPRKPERFKEVASLIEHRGFECIKRSESPDGREQSAKPSTIFLGDTMGELRKIYALADVVFVGRTLADMGGSDMMEVAALARPIVVGQHTENFTDMVRRLDESDAIRILPCHLGTPDVAGRVAETIGQLLDEPAEARKMGDRARDVVKRNRGATERTLDKLMEILQRAQHRTP